ncbi:hypothetical protein [Treponema sp.]|uniref:hypothetical protein n=1 Tax=Treponema sp. TaxID=166 RepID=UPI0025CD0AAE|nr:hypothetical protein [Treponema sp.]MCR5217415.1 hypothetical protein [Treponema sp.]
MNTLLFFRNGKLFFNTSLSSAAFARARFAEHLDEKGFLSSEENGVWKFTPFTFTETEEENDLIYLTAPGFDGQTLASFVDGEDKNKAVYAMALTVKILEQALIQNVKLDAVGAGGIFFSSDFKKVLFIPKLFFKTSLNVLGSREYTLNQGLYVNPGLKGENAIRYMQSALSYRLLAGRFPYEADSYEMQEEDFRDRNFIPLKNLVYGLKKTLADFVDGGLLQNPLAKEELKSFAAKQFPLETLYLECGLEQDGSIPSEGKLKDVKRHSSVSEEEFNRQREKVIEKKQSMVDKRRWLRRHRTILKIAAAAVLILGVLSFTYYSSWTKKPSTKGLTSLEVVRAYYTGVNNLDSDVTKYTSDGDSMRERDKVISNIYASVKQLVGMDINREAQTPAKWLNYNQLSFRIFGLTNFTVDGKAEELYYYAPARKDKKAALLEENGKRLSDSDKASYRVSYYLVNNALSPELCIEKYLDTVSLEYKKDRWLVTKIESVREESSLATEDFVRDYQAALKDNEDDLSKAAEALRQKYDFIPTEAELAQAAILIAGSHLK